MAAGSAPGALGPPNLRSLKPEPWSHAEVDTQKGCSCSLAVILSPHHGTNAEMRGRGLVLLGPTRIIRSRAPKGKRQLSSCPHPRALFLADLAGRAEAPPPRSWAVSDLESCSLCPDPAFAAASAQVQVGLDPCTLAVDEAASVLQLPHALPQCHRMELLSLSLTLLHHKYM